MGCGPAHRRLVGDHQPIAIANRVVRLVCRPEIVREPPPHLGGQGVFNRVQPVGVGLNVRVLKGLGRIDDGCVVLVEVKDIRFDMGVRLVRDFIPWMGMGARRESRGLVRDFTPRMGMIYGRVVKGVIPCHRKDITAPPEDRINAASA